MSSRRLTPDERRVELLDAAEQLVLAEGADALSLERVATEAGCSRNLAYTYFPNRDALLDALVERERRRIAADILERISRPATYEDWARAWVALVLDNAEHRGELQVLLFDQARQSGRRPRLAGAAAEALGLRLQQDFDLDQESARALGHVLGGALLGGIVAVSVHGVDRATVERALVDLMCRVGEGLTPIT